MTALLDGAAVLVVGADTDGADGCCGQSEEEGRGVYSGGRLVAAGELGDTSTLQIVALCIVSEIWSWNLIVVRALGELTLQVPVRKLRMVTAETAEVVANRVGRLVMKCIVNKRCVSRSYSRL